MHKGRTPSHVDRIHQAISGGDAAQSSVVASWQRSCRLHALAPEQDRLPLRLTECELSQARESLDRLIHAAQASLDRLFLAVGGVGCSVVMADRDGVVLERRGSPCDDATFQSSGLWTGAVWSEKCEGTNAIGTCLVEKRPLTIHRDQHFLARNAMLSCTTTPIFDETGNLAAALDVSSCRADFMEGFIQLITVAVAEAARRIEADNFRLAFPGARIVLAPTSTGDINALLAIDKDDLVIGATRAARRSLGLSAEQVARAAPAADVLAGVAGRTDTLESAERAVVLRALARAGDNVSRAAKELGVSRATLHRKLSRLAIHREG